MNRVKLAASTLDPESGKGETWKKHQALLILASSISILVFFVSAVQEGKLVFNYGFGQEKFIIIAFPVLAPAISHILYRRVPKLGFYLLPMTFLSYLGIVLSSVRYPYLLPMPSISFLAFAATWYIAVRGERDNARKIIIFVLATLFMFFVSKLLIFAVQPGNFPLTFVQIGSVFDTQFEGIPFLFQGGFAFYTPFFVIMVSPASIVLFTIIAILLTENYNGIFNRLTKGGNHKGLHSTLYGVAGALSCQCEGCISLFPTMTALILTVAMIPLLLESLILLLATYILLTRYFGKNVRVGFLNRISGLNKLRESYVTVSVVTVLLPLYEVIGIYMGQIGNIFFFFGTGIGMVLVGYADVIIYSQFLNFNGKKTIPAFLIALASIIGVMWFIPAFASAAFYNAQIFAAMNISLFISGVLFGIARSHYSGAAKKLVDEYLALMLGMIPVVILYISSTFRVLLWPEFGITQQVEFSIAAWAALLPLMWITTNLSLYNASAPATGVGVERHSDVTVS